MPARSNWPARSACCRSRPSRPRASRSPTSWAAGGIRTRACFSRWSAADDARRCGGPRGDEHLDSRRAIGRRALGRPAPARLDRHGPRAADRPAAARRADDLPRREPPGRGARPAHRPQPGARHDVVMVLHDLNLAARYADHLVAIADGPGARRRARRRGADRGLRARRLRPRQPRRSSTRLGRAADAAASASTTWWARGRGQTARGRARAATRPAEARAGSRRPPPTRDGGRFGNDPVSAAPAPPTGACGGSSPGPRFSPTTPVRASTPWGTA